MFLQLLSILYVYKKNNVMDNFKNHIIIDEHTESCLSHPKNKENQFFGYRIIESELMFIDGEFIFLTFCSCHRGYSSSCEFIESFLKHSYTKFKTVSYFEVDRGHSFNKDILKLIREDKLLFKISSELNYIYKNAAGKKYYIISKIKYVDKNIYRQSLDDKYKYMREYLDSNGYGDFIDTLDDLYFFNKPAIDDGITITTFNELAKMLNTKIKNRLKN